MRLFLLDVFLERPTVIRLLWWEGVEKLKG